MEAAPKNEQEGLDFAGVNKSLPTILFFSHICKGGGMMDNYGENSIGLIETLALVPAIEAADKMLKAADVELTAFEAGGSTLCTVFVQGDVAACRTAVAEGTTAAEKIGKVTAHNVMPRPIRALQAIVKVHEVSDDVDMEDGFSNYGSALGLLETYGIVFLLEGADAMCKAANVELIGYENIYDGYVSVLISGDAAACQVAVSAGVKAVRELGAEPYSSVVIANPHPQLKRITKRYKLDI